MEGDRVRCWGDKDPLYREYHDREWGTPVHDDIALFELLVLEGFQAGLSWATILRKRDAFRQAFDGFDPEAVAAYGDSDVERLLRDSRIIRNRRKIEAAINNAKRFIDVQNEFGSFDSYVWRFVGGKPVINSFKSFSEVPAFTAVSTTMSRDLKKRGFKFVGPTICYAYMQSIGLVNDHLTHCFRYKELAGI
jgi:DNA-3-methyladenine glycosylase I